MTTARIRGAAVLCGVAACSLLAACGGTTSGQPSASSGAPPANSSPSTHSSPTHSSSTIKSGGSASASLDNPCSLLTPSDLDQLGLTVKGKPGQSGKHPECSWTQYPGGLSIVTRSHYGLSAFASRIATNKPVTKLTVNGRGARKQADDSGGCAVGLRLTDTSRVDVTATFSDAKKSCSAAQQAAKLVEPHLPPQS